MLQPLLVDAGEVDALEEAPDRRRHPAGRQGRLKVDQRRRAVAAHQHVAGTAGVEMDDSARMDRLQQPARVRRSSGRSGAAARRGRAFRLRCSRRQSHAGRAGMVRAARRPDPAVACSVASSRRTNSRPIVLRTHQARDRKSLTTQSRDSNCTRQTRAFAQRPSRSSVRGADSKVGRSNRGKRSGKRGDQGRGRQGKLSHPAPGAPRGGQFGRGSAQDHRRPHVRPTCRPNGSPNGWSDGLRHHKIGRS